MHVNVIIYNGMYSRYTFYFFHFSSQFYSGLQKDAEKSPNRGPYFDFALGISYKVLFPVLDWPMAQFKTACTKSKNVIELSTDIVKQIWNIFCEWEIIMHLFGGPNKIKSRNWGNKVPLLSSYNTIHFLRELAEHEILLCVTSTSYM